MLDLVIGGAYRTVDANDVLFNAVGVLIGYVVFRIFAALYIVVAKRFGATPGRLPSYLYEIVCRVQTPRLHNFSVGGGWVPSVKFSPDGKYLAASSANGKLVVW